MNMEREAMVDRLVRLGRDFAELENATGLCGVGVQHVGDITTGEFVPYVHLTLEAMAALFGKGQLATRWPGNATRTYEALAIVDNVRFFAIGTRSECAAAGFVVPEASDEN